MKRFYLRIKRYIVMKTITEIIKDAYLKGGNDAQNHGLWKITSREQAIKYATEVVNKNDLLPDVMGRSGQLCPKCKCGYMFASEYNYIQCNECHYTIGHNCP
ncbi:MAG: hypothetical protein ACQERX_04830 [Bacillota bacterium]